MGIARSTYYDQPTIAVSDTELVETMAEIAETFEAYGYRRLAMAVLGAALRWRQPPPCCVHHSDRGSQYASGPYRQLLAGNGLVGSMRRRGNPYDNARAESFMKTLKVEAVYLMDYVSW